MNSCSSQVFTFIFSLFTLCGTAQIQQSVKDTSKPASLSYINPYQPDTNIRIFESPVVARTVQKVTNYHRLTNGVFPGFRVQIDFGQDRGGVMKTKSDFALKYPDVPCYLNYKAPYFKISVGDFRTKLEAIKFLNKIKYDYKSAFVINANINPPQL